MELDRLYHNLLSMVYHILNHKIEADLLLNIEQIIQGNSSILFLSKIGTMIKGQRYAAGVRLCFNLDRKSTSIYAMRNIDTT